MFLLNILRQTKSERSKRDHRSRFLAEHTASNQSSWKDSTFTLTGWSWNSWWKGQTLRRRDNVHSYGFKCPRGISKVHMDVIYSDLLETVALWWESVCDLGEWRKAWSVVVVISDQHLHSDVLSFAGSTWSGCIHWRPLVISRCPINIANKPSYYLDIHLIIKDYACVNYRRWFLGSGKDQFALMAVTYFHLKWRWVMKIVEDCDLCI